MKELDDLITYIENELIGEHKDIKIIDKELHLIKSGQKPLIRDSVSKSFYCGCEGLAEKDPLCNIIQCGGCANAESEQ